MVSRRLDTTQSTRGRILYIEDDSASAHLVERILTNQGYEVTTAWDGLEGITRANEDRPQLILMDINLPNMNGHEITTRLRSLPNFSNIPIVALTANNSPGNRKLALAAGCTGYLTKPIDVSRFPQQIDDFLQGRVEPLSPDEKQIHLEKHAQRMVEHLEEKVRELEAVNKRLQQLDQLKNDFIVLVSHELRTPLTLISGYSHLLNQIFAAPEADETQEPVRELVSGLDTSVQRMRDVVLEIINVSRITAGILEIVPTQLKLHKLVQKVCQKFEHVCQERALSLHIGDLKHLPPIEGDREQLELAIRNVLSNAIKFTPDGGHIYIVGRRLEHGVELLVRDTGIGIPPEEHARIFEQFYMLGPIEKHSTSKVSFQGGGLGLGLAITKGIVKAHNGRIWVESQRRDLTHPPGSTFHIFLPLQRSTRQKPKSSIQSD